MAHTNRAPSDKRKHPAMYPIGSKVGVYNDKGELVTGTIHSHDGGGWIYVSWGNGSAGLPGYLRSTNVFKIGA